MARPDSLPFKHQADPSPGAISQLPILNLMLYTFLLNWGPAPSNHLQHLLQNLLFVVIEFLSPDLQSCHLNSKFNTFVLGQQYHSCVQKCYLNQFAK